MYAIIFKVVWPYVQRLLASQAADYIQKRREQRLDPPQEEALPADCPPCPPCPPPEVSSPPTVNATAESKGWFAISGLLLGSALSLMIYALLRDTESQSGG